MHTAPTTITFHLADPAHVQELLDMLDGDGFRFEHSSAVVAPLHLFRTYGKHHASRHAPRRPRHRPMDRAEQRRGRRGRTGADQGAGAAGLAFGRGDQREHSTASLKRSFLTQSRRSDLEECSCDFRR